MPPVKRRSYTAGYKTEVLEEHGNRAAGRHYNISEKLCRDWRKQNGKLQSMKKTKKADRGSKPRWAQLEDLLEDWVLTQRAACRGVSTCQLRLKATTIADELDITGFRGGPTWIRRFLRRKSLALRARTTVCQKLMPKTSWFPSDSSSPLL